MTNNGKRHFLWYDCGISGFFDFRDFPETRLLRGKSLVDLIGIEPTTSCMPCKKVKFEVLTFFSLYLCVITRKLEILTWLFYRSLFAINGHRRAYLFTEIVVNCGSAFSRFLDRIYGTQIRFEFSKSSITSTHLLPKLIKFITNTTRRISRGRQWLELILKIAGGRTHGEVF